MTDIRDAQFVAKASDGKLVRRPLSPHISVYRWPITMLTSILNRVTGCALSVGTLLLVWWLVAAAAGPGPFATVQAFIASPIGLLLLFGWTASLAYHFFSGLRHLAWDMGIGFGQKTLNPLSYVVLALTALATAAIWIAGYHAMGG
jgi:succinate dehydrogenase / fumarate reductase cytochrome b subunit